MEVCAVVVTYNRKDLLLQCIDAILSQTYPVKKIILVDNASTDGTGELLRQKGYLEKENIIYSLLSSNTGGAGGFHEGIKIAHSLKPDWVWIMDDDVIPDETCLEELLNADKLVKEDVSFYASSIRNADGMAMNVPKLDRRQFTKYTDWYQYLDEGIVNIVKATFVSLLINRKAIDKCGLPWAPFFIWGDDSEYTQRIIRDYGPAFMVGKSKAIHLRGSAEELSIVKETNVNRIPLYFYLYRNNLIGFWEYENALYKFLCMGKLFWDALGVLIKGKYKTKKIKAIFGAFFSFVFGTYGKESFRARANFL
ncbi:glycosyltransferase family 2 protein [Butyrivibrio sp. YAB3001]|uniref:glycosyltransferase family 2 protein n=1 Tax=Butyrivibrio sp. YAB3001 TaxID=1520812 RepID=UPI0008F66635|nr:glycosyltransferase family 2 protein [Butyrivibrio sp. YAB3001]SFC98309.1 Glycosyltransferase, GT2 family [Butyrivibrio sp. YAB3001]